MRMPTAILFGAGNIGRGFLGQLLYESGLETVFVEVNAPIVNALNARRGYEIEIVGPKSEIVSVQSVSALHSSQKREIAAAIGEAELICTAVGANTLPQIADTLALGLTHRRESSGRPLNVLLCENLHDAADSLRNEVTSCLFADSREAILANTGFVQAVVSRMVPLQTPPAGDLLRVCTEAYKRLPVDANAIVGDLPEIVGVERVTNFRAHVERKMYCHNGGHAVLGYLGHAAKYAYGYEALRDVRIRALLSAFLDEASQALTAKHDFAPAEQEAHVADLRSRFANPALGDTCLRLARDPIRKLAPHDRLVGAARCCESQNISPKAMSWAIAAALRFDDPRDPVSQELQTMRREAGDERVLQRVSHVLPNEPLSDLITEALNAAR